MRNKSCLIIIVISVIIVILMVILLLTRKKDSGEVENTTPIEKLESVLSILPYESEGYGIYYYEDEDIYVITVRDYPFDTKIENALFLLNQYEETKDFTEDDVEIEYPSYMYQAE